MLKFRRVVLFLCGAVSTIGCEDRNDKLIDGGVHDAVPPEVADSANDVREMLKFPLLPRQPSTRVNCPERVRHGKVKEAHRRVQT